MSTEAVEVPIRSPATPAERMRKYRKRHRGGMRWINLELHATEIDVLVRWGYLEEKDRDDRNEVQRAAGVFITDAFFDAK